jgi:hypothetical protein
MNHALRPFKPEKRWKRPWFARALGAAVITSGLGPVIYILANFMEPNFALAGAFKIWMGLIPVCFLVSVLGKAIDHPYRMACYVVVFLSLNVGASLASSQALSSSSDYVLFVVSAYRLALTDSRTYATALVAGCFFLTNAHLLETLNSLADRPGSPKLDSPKLRFFESVLRKTFKDILALFTPH